MSTSSRASAIVGVVAVEGEQPVERHRPSGRSPRSLIGRAADVEGDLGPFVASCVVAEQPVDGGHRVSGAGQVRGDRSAGPLPTPVEPVPDRDHGVEPAGHRVDLQPAGVGEMEVLPVAGQLDERPGGGGRGVEISGGHGDLRTHHVHVS